MTDSNVAYLDSSAIVKLAKDEEESTALRAYVASNPRFASSDIAIVEVLRAALRQGPDVELKVREVFRRMRFIAIDRELLENAATLEPDTLRSLDAIHLASALRLGSELGDVVTYDVRMGEAARAMGLDAVAPR
ncbi:MAG: type II toxin-antitoxin system VapC family toxin [Tepidiformaceae bacterium]